MSFTGAACEEPSGNGHKPPSKPREPAGMDSLTGMGCGGASGGPRAPAGCTESEFDRYVDCTSERCGSQWERCMGPTWMTRGEAGGLCEDLFVRMRLWRCRLRAPLHARRKLRHLPVRVRTMRERTVQPTDRLRPDGDRRNARDREHRGKDLCRPESLLQLASRESQNDVRELLRVGGCRRVQRRHRLRRLLERLLPRNLEQCLRCWMFVTRVGPIGRLGGA